MMQSVRLCFRVLVVALIVDPSVGAEPVAEKQPVSPSAVRYTSRHLIVHTDLPPAKAQDLIDRLERTLLFAARYWGRESSRPIECYVVDDLGNWSESAMPHRLARVFVGGVSGATVGSREGAGREQRDLATVFASTLPGVAEHEMVHAYCSQNYGGTGPYWYKEGMAEMMVMHSDRKSGLQCSGEQIETLREDIYPTIDGIGKTGQSAQAITKSLEAMLADPKNRNRPVPVADWTIQDRDNVQATRKENLKCWLFCYLLLHNQNYSERFRTMGPALLSSPDGLRDLVGAYTKEVEFEYAFLLSHLGSGYRVDLCSWDWSARFQTLQDTPSIDARVRARQGYQPSGLTLVAGKRYVYQAKGTWSTGRDRPETNADGDGEGNGELIGVVMNNFRLSEPFVLGDSGSFTAPFSGDLFLRCGDRWNELNDNEGIVRVSFRYEFR